MSKPIGPLAVALCTTFAFAGTASAWDYPVHTTTIDTVGMHQSGTSFIYYVLPRDMPSSDTGANCSFGAVYWRPTATEVDPKAAFSLAISAYLAGKNVRLAYDQPGGDGTSCYLRRIDLAP